MNNRHSQKIQKRERRHNRVRSVVAGTADRPRLSVFRSASHIYAQLVDDVAGHTVAAVSSRDLSPKSKGKKTEVSTEVGTAIAGKAKEKGIKAIVFDRGGNRYQGRVKALAEAARAAGLEF